MSYAVKELFYTLQGEGSNSGRAAVFCRFTGCNLWSGRPEDRPRASCQFCDTDFVGTDGPGGGRFATAAALASAAWAVFHDRHAATPGAPQLIPLASPSTPAAPSSPPAASSSPPAAPSSVPIVQATDPAASARVRPLIVCTGGEPLLQLDAELVAALHAVGFEIAIETNGTLALPAGPGRQGGIDWVCVSPKAGTDLRLTAGDELKLVYPQPGAEPERYAHLPFGHFFLQPMDGPARAENTALAVRYCLLHPQWRLSLQTHKLLGIP